MGLREAAQMALDALELVDGYVMGKHEAKEALYEALAQPEQEPVAWGFQNTGITGSNRWMYLRETIPTDDQYRGVFWTPLYTTPPQRKWVGLTDEEMHECAGEYPWTPTGLKCCRAIEAKLREKNFDRPS